MQALAELVETGPDPAVDSVVRWRRIDLQRLLKERFAATVSPTSLSRLLEEMAFSHISGRPQHPRQDPQVTEAIKSVWPVPGLQAWRDGLKRSASMYPA